MGNSPLRYTARQRLFAISTRGMCRHLTSASHEPRACT
jgi:hypothetical protein